MTTVQPRAPHQDEVLFLPLHKADAMPAAYDPQGGRPTPTEARAAGVNGELRPNAKPFRGATSSQLVHA